MRIVVLDGFSVDQGELDWTDLRRLGDVVVHPRSLPNEVVPRAQGAEAILTNKVLVTRDVIDALPALRYVGIVATGTNVVDLEACRSRGIAVTNAPGYAGDAVAQFVLATLLHAIEDVGTYVNAVKANRWSEAPDYCFFLRRHTELAGKNIAIFGLGTIGRRVADLASAFGMNVIAAAVPGSTVEGRVPLDEALREADVVTFHCPLTDQTRQMVDAAFLGAMKHDAILINTSRGALVDESALLAALSRGRLRSVLLDVLEVEPPPRDHPLLDPNAPWAGRVAVTPHIAWGKVETRQRLIRMVAANLAAFNRGERLHRID